LFLNFERMGKMKRLPVSLFIIFLCAAIASAGTVQKQEVLIYTYTEKVTDYTCDVDGIDLSQVNYYPWEKTVSTKTGYVALQSTSTVSIAAWYVDTWKEKDANGVTHKYAKPEHPATYIYNRTNVNSKRTWILALKSLDKYTVLKGDEKEIWVPAVDKHADAPTALTGSREWYYTSADNILHAGTSTMTLKYHSKFTNQYYADPAMLDAMYAVEGIIGEYLADKGYEIIPIVID
jgi:hypothetical protein